jgi:hypothetical protein
MEVVRHHHLVITNNVNGGQVDLEEFDGVYRPVILLRHMG